MDLKTAASDLAENVSSQMMEKDFLGNSVINWGIAAGTTLISFALLLVIRALLLRRFKRLSESHPQRVLLRVAAVLLERTNRLALLIISVVIGAHMLQLESRPAKIVGLVGSVTIIVQLALWATATLRIALPLYFNRRGHDGGRSSAVTLIEFIVTGLVWVLALLLVLDNVGIDVTALIAGLGIGGIALALAVQNILGDLLSSLSIVLDKPFEVGDSIRAGDHPGTVEKVGIKTTRLRSPSGEQIIIPNSDLLSSRIRNLKRMYERMVKFSIGVTYQTSLEQLKEIPGIIRAAIETNDPVRFDRCHFNAYGDSALLFETVYFVLSSDFRRYMDIQQAVNLRIYEEFAKRGIEFAYPTTTVFVEQAARPEGAARA